MSDRSAHSCVMPYVVIGCVMPYIHDPKDRDAVSLVCRRWYELDASTRKHVTIALCYTTSPDRLRRRFPHLESLKLKGKPRASMFNLIPDNWGGYVTPWTNAISESFNCVRFLHFRRMIVMDSDLDHLSKARGPVLQSLQLDKCSGFSTDGLLLVTQRCRSLKTLFLEECTITDNDGKWLHELALHNPVLEVLNFYITELAKVDYQDFELLAANCRSLVSIKVSDCEILNFLRFFRIAAKLEEFAGGSFTDELDNYTSAISFPQTLRRLGLSYMSKNEMSLMFPLAPLLTKLDLLYALLDTEDHCQLIQMCPNLEILEARNVIGDRGLEAVGRHCKKLKRLRIERGADEQEMEDVEGLVTQRGLIALARGCLELAYIAVYVSDITNASLECMGSHLKNLCDFRLVLLEREERITDLPLDNGVRSLLRGCEKMKRFALYLRPGGLTNVGLGYIGQYSQNVRWMLLGYVGESDEGLLEFSKGCPSLQKLEMRGCCFTEHALASAVIRLRALRYLWVQGYIRSTTGRDLRAMARPFWNIELILARPNFLPDPPNGDADVDVASHPAHILAYYSMVGPRTDFPDTVIPFELPQPRLDT